MAGEDGGGQPVTGEDEPEDEHVIRMVAGVSLVLTGRGWVVEEDPAARLDRDDELVCTEEGHVLSGTARARCDLAKERGRAALMPTAQAIADAFQRAADTRAPIPEPARAN